MRRIEGRVRTLDGKRLYWVWAAMIQRCHNPKNAGYERYGGKGVTVCARWRESFDAFASDMGLPGLGLTLERNDATRGYSPGNCRWATRQEQNDNRPAWCHVLEVNGESMNMKQACVKYAAPGLTYRTVMKRIVERGWPITMALLIPSRVA